MGKKEEFDFNKALEEVKKVANINLSKNSHYS